MAWFWSDTRALGHVLVSRLCRKEGYKGLGQMVNDGGGSAPAPADVVNVLQGTEAADGYFLNRFNHSMQSLR